MYKIISARAAADAVPDGACVCVNSFLALSNPEILHRAIYERFIETGSPNRLRIFCSSGFGGWDTGRFADPYIAAGAVSEIIAGHYSSMPEAVRMAKDNKIEAYNLPLGVLSHLVRAAAAGKDGLLSEVGLGLFTDPRVGSCAMNGRSEKKLVSVVEVEGREYLYYKAPKIDVALIKGTSCDPNGNITFENEYLTVDALATAQAAKANGGIVIVQVDKVSHIFPRPRSVIVPGILVDYVVVDENAPRAELGSVLSGDVHVPSTQMDYYMSKLAPTASRAERGEAQEIIGERASAELRPGQVMNIGIGIPEYVGKWASRRGILKDLTATVEAGGIGGLPAPGVAFGATIGADMICDMAAQFDFYDGGGLDICFMGALECDRFGNVNAHEPEGTFVGIGGFANITTATKTVVFCLTFTTKGLETVRQDGGIRIVREGEIKKFRRNIRAISFSAHNARRRGQRVLYVTERCVFCLGERGLKLLEVYPGVSEADIRAALDFELDD